MAENALDEGLTDVEREAIAEGEEDLEDTSADGDGDSEGEAEASGEEDGASGTGEDAEGGSTDDSSGGEPAPEGEEAAEAEPVEAEAAPTGDTPEPTDEEDDGPDPVIATPELEEQSASQISVADVKKAIKAWDQKHFDGDLDEQEWIEKRDELKDLETDIKMDNRRRQDVAAANNAAVTATWTAEQNAFFSQFPEFNNQTLYGALNQHVVQLANMEDNSNKTGFQILKMARKIVMKDLGMKPGKASTPPTEETAPKEVAPPKPKSKKVGPTTLATAPAAAANPTGDTLFNRMDNMSGEEFEKALAKLSSDQADKYLSRD